MMTGRRRAAGPSGAAGGVGFAVVVAAVITGGAAGELSAQNGRFRPADFSYLGAFRLECGGDWCSYNLDGVVKVPPISLTPEDPRETPRN